MAILSTGAAGLALVEGLLERLGDGELDAVVAVASQLYGERVRGDLGDGDRAERAARVRSYQFGRSLPWLARIYERQSDGRVAPSWLLVERVGEAVHAMDPNPWNDIDEERQLPWADFLVLWELDGCTSLSIR